MPETLEKPQFTPEKEIKTPEIKGSREDFENLLNQLKKNIERGEYSAIIGDDFSGRIPTLIIREVIDRVYKSRERKSIKTFFLRPPTDDPMSWELLRQQLPKNAAKIKTELKDDKPRVLLVTELVSGGRSIEQLLEALNGQGLRADVAALELANPNNTRFLKMCKDHGANLFYSSGSAGIQFFMLAHEKEARPLLKIDIEKTKKRGRILEIAKIKRGGKPQEEVIQEREDINKLSEILFQKVFEKK